MQSGININVSWNISLDQKQENLQNTETHGHNIINILQC
jgi:hypothetical protein